MIFHQFRERRVVFKKHYHLKYDDFGLTIRDILNKIFWDPKEQRSHFELVYIHRGAPMDKKTISCNLIEEIGCSRFTYQSTDEGEVLIPFHRILEIRNMKTGQFLWKKLR